MKTMNLVALSLLLSAVLACSTRPAYSEESTVGVHPIDLLQVTSFEDAASMDLVYVNGGRASRVKINSMDGRYALRVELDANTEAWPALQFQLGADQFPADWSQYNGLMFDVIATAGKKTPFSVRIDADTNGQKNRAICSLFPTTTTELQTFAVRFDSLEGLKLDVFGLLKGVEGFEIPRLQQASLPNRKNVTLFQVYASRPAEDCVLFIDNVRLVSRWDSRIPTEGVVDQFGQNALFDWPGKIHSVEDLHKAQQEELQWLEAAPGGDDRLNHYYGLEHPEYKLEATGFFRLEKVDGVWWMVDPDGNLYFHNALCNAEPWSGPTATKGRESIFEWLPVKGDPNDPLAEAYEFEVFAMTEGMMNFDVANLIRKYGSHWKQQWMQMMQRRFAAWGYTGVHNWVKAEIWTDDKGNHLVPYSVTWHPQGNTPMLTQGIRHGMPDAFSEVFPVEADRHIRTVTQGLADDPMLVGHFFGAELDWRGLANAFPHLPKDTASAQRFREFLREKYDNNVAALRASWGNTTANFDELSPAESKSEGMQIDQREFLGLFADRYFKVSAEAIRRYNPNHLILGERAHPSNFQDEVILAMGRHCDAVSYDIYGDDPGPECDRVYELTGRPVIISEMGFRGRDRGLAGSLYTVATQADRATGYKGYLHAVVSKPYFVGMLTFCYRDQAFSAAPFGEGYNYGLVNVADVPYYEYVEAISEANRSVYDKRLQLMD